MDEGPVLCGNACGVGCTTLFVPLVLLWTARLVGLSSTGPTDAEPLPLPAMNEETLIDHYPINAFLFDVFSCLEIQAHRNLSTI